MSEKKLNIYWLDDDKSRFESYKLLLEDGADDFNIDANLTTIFVDSNIYDLVESWEKILPEPTPDVFLLDHIFQEQLPHKLTGNTLAHILRRTFNDVPVISVTAMYALPKRQSRDQEVHEYTALIHYNELDKRFEEIYRIGLDFKRLKCTSLEDFFNVIKVPKTEKPVMRLAVPIELIRNWTPTNHSQLAHWVISILIDKPGYLVDELRAATFLGLSQQGFKKVSHIFEQAKYRGPFAMETNSRWWQSSLRDILYEIVGTQSADYPQIAGRTLADFEESDLCRCYVTNEINAYDFVVAEAHPHGIWHVVRANYATSNDNAIPALPGFDEPLIIAGE